MHAVRSLTFCDIVAKNQCAKRPLFHCYLSVCFFSIFWFIILTHLHAFWLYIYSTFYGSLVPTKFVCRFHHAEERATSDIKFTRFCLRSQSNAIGSRVCVVKLRSAMAYIHYGAFLVIDTHTHNHSRNCSVVRVLSSTFTTVSSTLWTFLPYVLRFVAFCQMNTRVYRSMQLCFVCAFRYYFFVIFFLCEVNQSQFDSYEICCSRCDCRTQPNRSLVSDVTCLSIVSFTWRPDLTKCATK